MPCSGALMPTRMGLLSEWTQAFAVPTIPQTSPPVQSASVVQENVVPSRLGPEQAEPATSASATASQPVEERAELIVNRMVRTSPA